MLDLHCIRQLFHPTITTGIAPMAVLIYMNAAIFAGELTLDRVIQG